MAATEKDDGSVMRLAKVWDGRANCHVCSSIKLLFEDDLVRSISLRTKLIALTTGLIALTVGVGVFLAVWRELKISREQTEEGMKRMANFISRPRPRARRGGRPDGAKPAKPAERRRGRWGDTYQERLDNMARLERQRRGRSPAWDIPRPEVAFIVVRDMATGETEYAFNSCLEDLLRFLPAEATTPKDKIEALEELIKSGEISQDELRVLQVERPSRRGGDAAVQVRVGYSLSRLRRAVLKAQFRRVCGGIALILLGAMGATLMANHLLRPIKSLALAAEKVAAGDFEHQVEPSTRDELGDLTTIFNQMVTRLRNQQRMEHELALARVFQTRLLPQSVPQIPGFEIGAKNVPSRIVSGDFYDFLTLGDDRLALVVGDVSGKGMPAALLVAGVLSLIRSESSDGQSITEIVERINSFVYRNSGMETFVTMFYSVLNINDRRLSFCNAGHDYPLLLRAGGGKHEKLKSTGGLLGIGEDTPFSTAETILDPEDLLLIYSDGVTDTFMKNGRPLGKEGLLELGRELREEDATNLVERLYERISGLAGEAERADDFTLLAVKALSGKASPPRPLSSCSLRSE